MCGGGGWQSEGPIGGRNFIQQKIFAIVGQTPECLTLTYELKLVRVDMLNRLLLGFCIVGYGVIKGT